MPTYEYMCEECGGEFEAFHSMKADPLTRCQLCGAEGSVRRKIGRGAGIIFKGSGFYETDFKDKKGNSGGPHSASESKSPAEGKNGTSEGSNSAESVSKSAEKTETAASSDSNTSKKSESAASPSTKSTESS